MIKQSPFPHVDFSLSQIPNPVFALISFTALLIWAAIISPMTPGLSKYRIKASDISVFPASSNVLEERFISSPQARPLGLFGYQDKKSPHKFHVRFNEDRFEGQKAAIYIPSTAENAYLTINGIPSSRQSTSFLYAPGKGQANLFYLVPKYSLNPGPNRAHLHYMNDRLSAGLKSVYLGPAPLLERAQDRQAAWEKTLPPISLGLSFLLILMTLTGIAFSDKKRVYLWMGLALTICSFQFLLSYFGQGAPFTAFLPTMNIALPLGLIICLSGFVYSCRKIGINIGGAEIGLIGFAFLGPVIGLSLILFSLNLAWPNYFATITLIGLLPLAILWLLQNVFADLANHRTRLEQLKARVDEQAAELDEQSQIIARQMQDQAILEERQRFTRDIHDGIGGQLVSLLLRARRGKLGKTEMIQEIQSGINDLRLIVDSMDHVGDDLSGALVSLKARISRQLEAAHISLDWQQSANLGIQFKTPRGVLNLYRFIQEAVTNLVRHSGAEKAQIRILQSHPDENIEVRISDDGKGLTDNKGVSKGKGLNSLEQRAQLLSGQLAFGPGIGGQGLQISLSIPAKYTD